MPKNFDNNLIKYFDDLYLIEKQARDLYNTFLKEIKDKQVRKTIISIRDDEIIAAADEQGLAMVLTGMRHFRH